MNLLADYMEQLNKVSSDYQKLCEMLTYEEVVLDIKLCQKLEREKNQLFPIANKFHSFTQLCNEIDEYQTLIEISSSSEQYDIKNEIEKSLQKKQVLAKEIISLLEIQNAQNEQILVLIQANNANAQSMQKDIKNGYIAFCNQHNLQVHESITKNTTQIKISGLNSKTYFFNEIGIHKQTEINSDCSCTVYVLDYIPMEEISFDDKDIKISICRSSGAGGQHINTTDSAVKITHLKSGISTICQSERSQFQNKELALIQLKEKVTSHYQKQYEQYISSSRTKQYKSINFKNETKLYNYNTKTITAKNKIISFDTFLKGEDL